MDLAGQSESFCKNLPGLGIVTDVLQRGGDPGKDGDFLLDAGDGIHGLKDSL